MLDGRSIIEVRYSETLGRTVFDCRTWLVRTPTGRYAPKAIRSPHTRTWFVPYLAEVAEYPSLRETRRGLFRGNGRLTGGHPEITHPVPGPMSLVNVKMLVSVRTAPGTLDYWS